MEEALGEEGKRPGEELGGTTCCVFWVAFQGVFLVFLRVKCYRLFVFSSFLKFAFVGVLRC